MSLPSRGDLTSTRASDLEPRGGVFFIDVYWVLLDCFIGIMIVLLLL